MVDYVSRKNNIPLAAKYNALRTYKLKDVIYPVNVEMLASHKNNSKIKEQCWEEAIPEFKRHNIVEADVYNVAQ